MNESLEIEQRLESLSKLDPAIKVELHKSKVLILIALIINVKICLDTRL